MVNETWTIEKKRKKRKAQGISIRLEVSGKDEKSLLKRKREEAVTPFPLHPVHAGWEPGAS